MTEAAQHSGLPSASAAVASGDAAALRDMDTPEPYDMPLDEGSDNPPHRSSTVVNRGHGGVDVESLPTSDVIVTRLPPENRGLQFKYCAGTVAEVNTAAGKQAGRYVAHACAHTHAFVYTCAHMQLARPVHASHYNNTCARMASAQG